MDWRILLWIKVENESHAPPVKKESPRRRRRGPEYSKETTDLTTVHRRAACAGEFGAELRLRFQPVLHVSALRLPLLQPFLVGSHRNFLLRHLHPGRGRLRDGRRDGSGHGCPSLKEMR